MKKEKTVLKPSSTESENKPKRNPIRWKMGMRGFLFLLLLVAFVTTILVADGVVILLDFFFHLHLSLTFPLYVFLCSAVIGAVILVFLSRFVSAPIVRLGEAMRRVAAGDFEEHLATDSAVVELRECYENFNLMTDGLRENESIQADFVSNVSHEFKTPLTAIEGYATLLCEEPHISAQGRENVRRIVENTGRMKDLVNHILLLSKIEHQVIPPPSAEFLLDELIRRILIAYEHKWSAKGIVPNVELDEVRFFGNEGLLSHVFGNLLDNAIKFNHPGGTLAVTLRQGEGSCVFTIRDSGIGMTPQQCAHIFDRFYQADAAHSGEGNGLGLPLVKRILDVLGGTVRVESVPDEGTTFTVTLPNGVAR